MSTTHTRGLVRALFACGLVAVGTSRASADPALRVQRDLRGDFVLIGNTMAHDCGGGFPAMPDPVVGTVGMCVDDNPWAPDVYWRADDPMDGQARAATNILPADARSTAVLDLPDDATVAYARLYWAALSDAASPDGTARIQRPSAGLDVEVTADDTFEVAEPDDNGHYWYHSTADVTSLVAAQKDGAYRIAGVGSENLINLGDPNPVVAWALVVFYEDFSEPSRNLAIFDGLDLVDQDIGSASATLSGFLVPNAGFDAKLGVVAYEGEAQFTGDSLRFNDVSLSNAQNPANNFFNATRTVLGAPQSIVGDLPQLTGTPRSLSNVDLDVVSVTSLVSQGDTSATIEARSSLDTFLLGAFITSISTFKPDFTASNKTVTDDDGGAIRPGDQLTYRIVAVNSGSDTSVDTVVTDPLPVGVTYVADSLVIEAGENAGALSDDDDNDEGEYDAATRTITVRIGDGASGMQGGELAIGESVTIAFRVTVDASASGTIANQAIITAEGEQGAPSEDTVTDGNGPADGEPPTEVVVDACTDDDDCTGATPRCDISSTPQVCVECVTSAQCTAADEPDCNVSTHVCECASGSCVDDSDGDGISDSAEADLGTDSNDGDSDDDGVPDGSELAPADDSDGDGLINALDADSDNDGLFDGTELGLACSNGGTDVSRGNCRPDGDMGTTVTSPVLADTDGGGVRDGSEDADLDGVFDDGETDPTAGAGADDAQAMDRDGDGLSDALEESLHSDPEDVDSDDDGVPDGEEPNPSGDVDGDGLTSVLDVDSDNDGLFDGTELGKTCSDPGTDESLGHCRPDADGGATKTFALVADTDGGGARDGSEDSNLNGVTDAGETNPIVGQGADDSMITDTDGDGLGDALEMQLGTDPNDGDSDDDGALDGAEANPSDDGDGDGVINALDPDSDGDGLFDGTELGFDCDDDATDASEDQCVPDADAGATRTSPVNADTDFGGKADGVEDANKNGAIGMGETDPLDPRDDTVGDACAEDVDCGTSDSGVICVSDVCALGCRGTGGNSCPADQECSSSTSDPGTCSGGGMAGSGGAGGTSGMSGGAGGMSAGAGGIGGAAGAAGAAGSGLAAGSLGGGGCDCSTTGMGDRSGALWIFAALALLVSRRRR